MGNKWQLMIMKALAKTTAAVDLQPHIYYCNGSFQYRSNLIYYLLRNVTEVKKQLPLCEIN